MSEEISSVDNIECKDFENSNDVCVIASIKDRFFALLLDIFFLFIINIVVAFVWGIIGGIMGLHLDWIRVLTRPIGGLVSLLYESFFLSTSGATPGKKIMHLQVLHENKIPTFGRAAGRWLARCLSGFILMIGYFMAFGNAQHKTLHDRLCDTLVVKRND